jgi:hypothetical protein
MPAMTIEELLASTPVAVGAQLDRDEDPLRELDALREAQVLDVRLDLISGSIGVLLEMRVASQVRRGNTGLLVLRGAHDLRWSGEAPARPMCAHWIVGSAPAIDAASFTMSLAVGLAGSGGMLELAGVAADFYVGDVPGLGEAPPDYTDLDRAGVRGQVTDWGSTIHLIAASSTDEVAG